MEQIEPPLPRRLDAIFILETHLVVHHRIPFAKIRSHFCRVPVALLQPGVHLAADNVRHEVEGLKQRGLAGSIQANQTGEFAQTMFRRRQVKICQRLEILNMEPRDNISHCVRNRFVFHVAYPARF